MLDLRVVGEGLGTDVGGEELGVAGFEAEVGGGLVAEEVGGVGEDVAIKGDHGGEVVGWVFGRLGAEPVEAVLEGADDAVGVAGGEGGLPAEHPVGVELREHKSLVYLGRALGERSGVGRYLPCGEDTESLRSRCSVERTWVRGCSRRFAPWHKADAGVPRCAWSDNQKLRFRG